MLNKELIKYFQYLSILICCSCSVSYHPLPVDYQTKKPLQGTYYNEPILNPYNSNKLWSFIDKKNNINKDGLYVQLDSLNKKKWIAKLIEGEQVLLEKKLKVKQKKDRCYYTKRRYYLIPLLPVIWAYFDSQERLGVGENSVILEYASGSGGVFIIFAGGSSFNNTLEYKRVGSSE